MAKLNQMVAVETGLKPRTAADTTKVYHVLQKPELFAGISRTYQPKDEEGETFPSERTMVRHRVDSELDKLGELYSKLLDVQLTKDTANTKAIGRVEVDGVAIFEAPTTFLLTLKKHLDDLRTMMSRIPVLDPAEVWIKDESVGGYRTEPAETTRTRKVPKVLLKYEATDRHPAQTEVYTVDEIVGTWRTTKFSGAIPQAEKDWYIGRVNELQDAVKVAIEEANSMVVDQIKVGEAIFDFLFEH